MPGGDKVPFLIPAAGLGARLGASVPKALIEVAERRLVHWTIEAICASPSVGKVVVAAPAGFEEDVAGGVAEELKERVVVVGGGDSRFESVTRALDALEETLMREGVAGSGGLVGVHDGARPLVTVELVERVVARARETGGAVAAVSCEDTLRWQLGGGRAGETVDRRRVRRVQTPQVFGWEVFRRGIRQAAGGRGASEPTDEAELVQALGEAVFFVDGDPANVKLTWPEQLSVVEKTLEDRGKRGAEKGGAGKLAFRVGLGFDAHRLSAERRLRLGGVELDFPGGLSGHSDGDVVCHAICDGVLGGAKMGDIGIHFPDSDERWRGALGLELLRRSREIVETEGWVVGSVDVVVIAEGPSIAPHREEMEKRIASALSVSPVAVSVKGTTTEGMGFCGRSEGIAAQAVVLMYQKGAERSNG